MKAEDMKYAILSFMLLAVASTIYAQDIRLVTENYPPFQIQEEGKPPTGFGIEIVEAMKKRAVIDAKIEFYPWARAYHLALEKPNIFIFTMGRSKERETLFKWVGEFYRVTDGFFALSFREDIIINSIEEAKNYTTAVPRGDLAAVVLEGRGFTKDHLHYVPSQEQCVIMLHKERVDLNSNNDIGFFAMAKKLGLAASDFKRVYVINETAMEMAASRGTSDVWVEKMQRALKEVKSDGTYDRLRRKYFPFSP